ncbi:MAG: SLOG family protein [Planctomycetota bacterium]
MSNAIRSGEPYRIIVTGSRHYRRGHPIMVAIADAVTTDEAITRPITIITGGAAGADSIATRFAGAAGYSVQQYTADWATHGRSAGPKRNQLMVDAGADICLAFPIGDSQGTRDCMRRCVAAGIPVKEYPSNG